MRIHQCALLPQSRTAGAVPADGETLGPVAGQGDTAHAGIGANREEPLHPEDGAVLVTHDQIVTLLRGDHVVCSEDFGFASLLANQLQMQAKLGLEQIDLAGSQRQRRLLAKHHGQHARRAGNGCFRDCVNCGCGHRCGCRRRCSRVRF